MVDDGLAIERFWERLDIPETCFLNKRVFKKLFEENGTLDATDKKALKDDVAEIRWLYTLKPSTINIPRFTDHVRDYPEVAVLHVTLSSPLRFKRLAALMQRAIPYPLVVVFTHEQALALSLADKRINQADKAKMVIEQTFDTGWIDLSSPAPAQRQFIDDMSIKRLSFVNFLAFYDGFVERVVALNCAALNGVYILKRDSLGSRLEIIREIQKIELNQAEIRNRLKKETQMGAKVELNGQIRKLALKVDELKQGL